MNPIDQMLSTVQWVEGQHQSNESGEPFATHEGVLHLFDMDLRCYRLNTGQAIIHADDFKRLLRLLE